MLNLTLISFAGIEFNGTMNEYRMEKYDLSENLWWILTELIFLCNIALYEVIT